MQCKTNAKPRMTWIEIAITGVTLAVLAALVVPQFSQAGMDPRERQLRSAAQVVRGQIEMYRLQHDNRYPTLQRFAEQMTQSTDSHGQLATPGAEGLEFGPYLRCIPANPYSGTNDVSAEPGASAWFYNEKTGDFRSNHAALRSPGR